jgi:hypothetical protein
LSSIQPCSLLFVEMASPAPGRCRKRTLPGCCGEHGTSGSCRCENGVLQDSVWACLGRAIAVYVMNLKFADSLAVDPAVVRQANPGSLAGRKLDLALHGQVSRLRVGGRNDSTLPPPGGLMSVIAWLRTSSSLVPLRTRSASAWLPTVKRRRCPPSHQFS